MTKILSIMLLLLLCATTAFAFIGNKSSRKFHKDKCSYVYRMNESNKVFFRDKDQAIGGGYVPCKVCRP